MLAVSCVPAPRQPAIVGLSVNSDREGGQQLAFNSCQSDCIEERIQQSTMQMPGRPLYSKEHRKIVRTAAPLSVGFALQSVMSISETLIMAQSGAVPLAAVSIAASLAGLIYLVVIGFVSASVPLIAKAVATKRQRAAVVAVLSALAILACSILFGLLALFLAVRFTHLLSVSSDVATLISAWIRAAIWGFPAMCLFFWFRSVGTALGQTGFVGRVLAVAAAAHLTALMLFALDSPWSFGWGTFGAGVAHSVACWVALLGSAYSIFLSSDSKLRAVVLVALRFRDFGFEIRQHIALGIPVTARIFLVEGFGYFLVLILPLLVSAAEISAHAIGLRLAAISGTLALGLSSAAAAHIGSARGRKNIDEAIVMAKSALELGVAIGLLGLFGLLIMAAPILRYLEGQGAPISFVFVLLIVAYQALAVIQTTATGALLGFEKTIVPLIATFVGPWCTCLSLMFVTSLIWEVDIVLVWACLVISHLVSSLICVLALGKQAGTKQV